MVRQLLSFGQAVVRQLKYGCETVMGQPLNYKSYDILVFK